MVGRIYKEDHYTLLHTKYECSGPCGFGEEERGGQGNRKHEGKSFEHCRLVSVLGF